MNCKLFLFLLGALCITGRVRAGDVSFDDLKKVTKAAKAGNTKVTISSGEVTLSCTDTRSAPKECKLPDSFTIQQRQADELKDWCTKEFPGGSFKKEELGGRPGESTAAVCVLGSAGPSFKILMSKGNLDIRLLRSLLALLMK